MVMVTLLSSSSSRGHAPLFPFLNHSTRIVLPHNLVRPVPSVWGLPSLLTQPPVVPSPGLDLEEGLSPVSGQDPTMPTQLHVLL